MRIAEPLPEFADGEFSRRATAIATQLGNQEHTLIFDAWGRHSVFVRGPFLERIRDAVESQGEGRIHMLPDIHVEFIPRLREEEVYFTV